MHGFLPYRIFTFCILVFTLTFFPVRVQAQDDIAIPTLGEFIADVTNGETDALRGIYAPNVMALPIVPQPENNPAFVSSKKDTLTQFGPALQYETTGLLAHNYLAGKKFFLLKEGQLIYLIYGDGRIETYVVTESMRFQALTPNSVTSNFVDLDSGEQFSASSLFSKVYNRPGQLVLQTCIYAGGESSWGRLFVIAEPYKEISISLTDRVVSD